MSDPNLDPGLTQGRTFPATRESSIPQIMLGLGLAGLVVALGVIYTDHMAARRAAALDATALNTLASVNDCTAPTRDGDRLVITIQHQAGAQQINCTRVTGWQSLGRAK